jgi:glycosyltransferase involved in cell wall biosynthesis
MTPNHTDGSADGPGRRLRVVFVDHVARLSGGEIALLRLLPTLAAYVDVHVVLGEEGPLVGRLRSLGIDTEVMPLAPRLRDVRKETVRPARVDLPALAHLPPYIFRLSRRFRALDADLVHTNSLKAALYGSAAARLAGVPAVWHVRDRIAADYLPRSAVAFVRAASRILPTAVIANSQATLDTLPRLLHSSVLYNPVVPDAVEEPPSRPARRIDALTIGTVGRLAPWKGQEVFLDAFAQAFRGTSVRGRIIGSALFGEDAYAESLRERAEYLGISGQIEFRGFRDDVWQELSELDVLVHCSVQPEPFGQVVLEGMAAGVPVIATAAGGPAELMTDGVDGILTTPGDPAELAAVLRGLADDPDLRASLANAARWRSREFTPERTAAQLLSVYREIVTRSS